MQFSQLIQRVRDRGLQVQVVPTPASASSDAPLPDPDIRALSDDSRKIRPGDLFIARTGTKKSGADFIDQALANGALAIILESPNSQNEIQPQSTQSSQSPAVNVSVPSVSSVVNSHAIAWAQVSNANLACALLAHELAGHPTANIKMIGITGTKGKTTVAYLLRSVLQAAGHTVGMIGTVEIDTGGGGKSTTPADMTTPGSVELVELFSRMRDNGVTHCVMEVSSHALHQHRTAGIDFAVAIFTNLTGDHLDYHKTMEEYAAAKAMLFEGLKENAAAIINADDPWAERIICGCRARIVPYRVTDRPRTGPGVINPMELPAVPGESQAPQRNTPVLPDVVPPGGFAGHIWRMTSRGMGITVGFDGPAFGQLVVGDSFATPLVGRHNCYNLTSAYAAATVLGALHNYSNRKTRANFPAVWRNATGAPGRLQRVNCDAPFTVFVDYAHTHDALENVLSALRTTMASDESAKPSRDRKGATELPPQSNRSLTHGRGSDTSPQLICLFGCGGDRDRTKRPKMAAIAERLADKVILTSDNPRTENPLAIIEEICTGFSPNWKSENKITVEPDRRAAIRAAIALARPGDVVLLAGKGHENYQIIGTTKHHFDDVEEAQAALQERLASDQHPSKRQDTQP